MWLGDARGEWCWIRRGKVASAARPARAERQTKLRAASPLGSTACVSRSEWRAATFTSCHEAHHNVSACML